jgi:manganese transport protein
MSNILDLFLGVVTSMGGFVDIGELVFAADAGARFLYSLLWVLALGTMGIIVFSEMSGRVAIATKKAVFDVVRERLGERLGLVNLILSNIVNLITCTAEIGGIAIILHLLTGFPYKILILASALLVGGIIWVLPFKWLERTLGVLGLCMLTFVAATVALHPPWKEVAQGFLPWIPTDPQQLLLFGYFAIGILSSTMMPYEIYFYSSGAIEDKWAPKDAMINKITTIVGLSLGSLLAAAIIINAGVLFHPFDIEPHLLGTSALQAAVPFGRTGIMFALFGMLFAILGAAVETALSGAYTICQFYKIPWGREKEKKQVKTFTGIWAVIILIGMLILYTGVDPVSLVEYSVIFSVVVMPLSYYALLRASDDAKEMGRFANGPLSRALGWAFLGLVSVVAVSAIPLMILTRAGNM